MSSHVSTLHSQIQYDVCHASDVVQRDSGLECQNCGCKAREGPGDFSMTLADQPIELISDLEMTGRQK